MDIDSRGKLKTLILPLFALGVPFLAMSCEGDPSCVETATCKPRAIDGGSADTLGNDSGSAGDAARADVSEAGSADAAKDAVAPDGPTSDERRPDASDVAADGNSVDSAGGMGSSADASRMDASNENAQAPDSSRDIALEDTPGFDMWTADTFGRDAPDASDKADVALPCNSATCPTGCCDSNNLCVMTPGNNACGTAGGACEKCGVGRECNGTSCVCTPQSCTTGCCSGTTCVAFADQSDTTCGAAKTCGACSATQDCDKTTGSCACTASSCPTGCCSGDTCVPFGSQGDGTCGLPGTCGSCSNAQKCNGSGACIAKTWCEMQTNPGVPAADYQCLDFDTGMPPASVWAPTQSGGPIWELVTDQVNSAPNALHIFQSLDNDTVEGVAQLSWSTLGGLVSSVTLEADIYHRDTEGGGDMGYPQYLCVTAGPLKACLNYRYPSSPTYAKFSITVPTGASGPIGTSTPNWDVVGDIGAKTWTHVRMEMSRAGTITFSAGGVEQTCPTGVALNTGAATVQLGGTLRTPGSTWGNFTIDNVITYVTR